MKTLVLLLLLPLLLMSQIKIDSIPNTNGHLIDLNKLAPAELSIFSGVIDTTSTIQDLRVTGYKFSLDDITLQYQSDDEDFVVYYQEIDSVEITGDKSKVIKLLCKELAKEQSEHSKMINRLFEHIEDSVKREQEHIRTIDLSANFYNSIPDYFIHSKQAVRLLKALKKQGYTEVKRKSKPKITGEGRL